MKSIVPVALVLLGAIISVVTVRQIRHEAAAEPAIGA